jgi:hypothetical protein
MKFLNAILDFYIESSLHVALAVYALIRITFIKLNISYDESVAYFGFYGTIVGYNFIKYDELTRIRKVKRTKTFMAIIGISIVASFASLYYFLALNTNTKLVGFAALIITLFYTLPFFPNRNNMRNWSGLKIYLVAIAWVGVTVLLPVFNSKICFSMVLLFNCLQRFIFVFVLLLIFEIIDLQVDSFSLATIPQKIGVKLTKKINYFLIIMFLLFDFLKQNNTHKSMWISFFVASVLVLFTFFSSSKRNKYYTSFWVESVPVFWLVLVLLLA